MLFRNLQNAVVAPCIASLFQGKETGVQNVFQGGSLLLQSGLNMGQSLSFLSNEDYLEQAECWLLVQLE